MNANVRKTNTGKLLAAVLAIAMIVTGVAVLSGDSGVDAASNDGTTYLSGDVTATQEFTNGTNVVVNDNLRIPAGMALVIGDGATFTLNAGSTITINAGGQLIFDTGAKVTINGNIVAEGTNSNTDYENYYIGAIVNNIGEPVTTGNAQTYFILAGTITLEEGAQLRVNSTDNKQVSPTNSNITVGKADTGVITLQNGASIDVTKRSSRISTIENQELYMYEGSTFNLNGYVTSVNVKATGSATYYTAGVVSISHEGTSDSGNRSTSDLTFTVTTQTISAFIGDDTTQTYTVRQYAVNVDGTLNGYSYTSESVANYYRDVITFKPGYSMNAGVKTDYAGNAVFNTANSDGTVGDGIVPMNSITGTLNIGEYSMITFDRDSYTIISGTLDMEYAEADAEAEEPVKTVTIYGDLYVSGTVNGVIEAITTGDNSDSTSNVHTHEIIIDGGSATLTNLGQNIAGQANIGTAIGSIVGPNGVHIRGTMYIVEGTGSNAVDTIHISDFDDAITAATSAGVEDVYVFAYGAQNLTTSEDAINRGAFELTSNVTIPSNMTVTIWNAFVIGENGVLTLEDGAEIVLYTGDRMTPSAKLFVDGKLVDNGGAMESFETDANFIYEVKKLNDDETVATYTSLRIALSEAESGETIQLHNQITIEEDLTIPTGVTVVSGPNATEPATPSITLHGATLTINGTLEMADGATVNFTKDGNVESRIILNNVIVNATTSTFTNGTVAGAYFTGDVGTYENENLVTSPSIAAENSTSATSGITLRGEISMGDATFTAGENGLTVTVADEAKVSAGTITLDGANFVITGTYTGAVSSDVTAGTSTIDFSNASGITVGINSADDGQTVTETMTIAGNLSGNMTISSGVVYIATGAPGSVTITYYAGTETVDDPEVRSVLTVGSNGTLIVPRNTTLTVNANAAENAYSALVVNGTMTVQNGGTFNVDALNAENSTTKDAQADINGTLNIENNTSIQGVLNVTGTLAVTEAENTNVALTINNRLNVGNADGASGTVTGAINLSAAGDVITVYPAGDVSNADINVQNGTSNAYQTTFYINGEVYITTYALSGTSIGQVLGNEDIQRPGYYPITLLNSNDTLGDNQTTWYETAEMLSDEIVRSNAQVQNVSAAYANADPMAATVYVSVGTGMSVYIDNVRYGNGSTVELTVGSHTVSVQVNPGYAGTPSILFNGNTVSESFEITADMADGDVDTRDVVLSVTGDITLDTGTSSGSTESSDDGMGLTDYLLIILVILIVVMAIMVAMRLMRS